MKSTSICGRICHIYTIWCVIWSTSKLRFGGPNHGWFRVLKFPIDVSTLNYISNGVYTARRWKVFLVWFDSGMCLLRTSCRRNSLPLPVPEVVTTSPFYNIIITGLSLMEVLIISRWIVIIISCFAAKMTRVLYGGNGRNTR